MVYKILLIVIFSFFTLNAYSQTNTTEYKLNINKQTINITGQNKTAMTINGQIPGPTLRFKEGEKAVIYVKNNLNVETSIHWHGILIPNFYDGVPYLTTPPIKPGKTMKFEFPVVQNGTYWYHSHTGLQEQLGVYGSIVIEPKEKKLEYDKDLVLVFSDWTDENPEDVLKNLKRRNEWYSVKKDTATPLANVILRGGLSAQLKFWQQRMPGVDIADIYYGAFLTNGAKEQQYPEFKPGEKVRVRMINASSSTYYWLTFGGETPSLVSADGQDVVPVKKDKLLFGIAETYDFLVTIPTNVKLEVRASAMDGSGKTSAFLGSGSVLAAQDVPKPDYIAIMKAMAEMDMKMGAPAMIFDPAHNTGLEQMKDYGMQMNDSEMSSMKKDDMMQSMDMKDKPDDMKMMNQQKPDKKMDMGKMNPVLNATGMGPDKGYDFLKSPVDTTYSKDKPVKDIELNLNGNM